MDAFSPPDPTALKRAAMQRLTEARKRDRLEGYVGDHLHLRDVGCECDHVVPWTKSAENLDADLMLIAQDWASEDFLRGLDEDEREEQRRDGQISRLPTNRNLKNRVLPLFGVSFPQTYATDAFVFVKRGSMTAPIPFSDLVRSTDAYALPQIEIVRPKMVLCIGSAAFNAVRRAALERREIAPGTKRDRSRMGLKDAWRIVDPFHTEHAGVPIFGIAHTGGRGTQASGGPSVTGPRLAALAAFFAERCRRETSDASQRTVAEPAASV